MYLYWMNVLSFTFPTTYFTFQVKRNSEITGRKTRRYLIYVGNCILSFTNKLKQAAAANTRTYMYVLIKKHNNEFPDQLCRFRDTKDARSQWLAGLSSDTSQIGSVYNHNLQGNVDLGLGTLRTYMYVPTLLHEI